MKKLKTAVIGVGNMGQHHARIYAQLKETDLAAISDLDVGRGKKIACQYKTNFFKNYQQLIKENPDLDVVSIAVPTKNHRRVACAFLRRGINVLLEKPIADTIQAGKQIIKTARENNVKLMIGHVERFNPAVIRLKKLVDQGELGEIISVIARRVGGFPAEIKDANVILDLAVHDIDIINYLLDEKPDKVYKHKRKFHTRTQEDSGEIFLLYKKAAGYIQINWVTPLKIRKLEVTGSKSYAELNYLTQDLVVYKAEIRKERADYAELIKLGKPIVKKIAVNREEPLKLEILSFMESIRENKQPLVTAEEALESLRICLN